MQKDQSVWVALTAGCVLLLGGIYYFAFAPRAPERSGPAPNLAKAQGAAAADMSAKSASIEPERQPEVKSLTNAVKPASAKKAADAGSVPAKQPVPKKQPAEEGKPIVATNQEPIPVSVSRLHRQQLTDPAAAALEYDRKLLEVRGSLVRTSSTRDGLQVVFASDTRAEISWKVWPDTIAAALQNVRPGQRVTLRGVYEAGAKLHHAELVRGQSSADEAYLGKIVDLVGVVGQVGSASGQEFTSLRFEPDSTDAVVGVECLFKKQAHSELDGLAPGRFVIVRGKCGGLSFNTVTLHNCEVLYDYTLKNDIPRREVGRFILEYELDIREEYRFDTSDAEPAVTAAQLLAVFKEPLQGMKQYDGRWIEVDGATEAVDLAKSAVVLEGGTDQTLKIKCLFSPAQFRRLKAAPAMKIRGRCAGLDGKYIKLDNCEALWPAPIPDKTGMRLDAEFLPFRGSQTLVYYTAYYNGKSARRAVRQTLTFKDDRVIEIVGTHQGEVLSLDSIATINWTKKIAAAKPLWQHYRLHAGRVEINQGAVAALGTPPPPGDWEPVLVVGAQAGDRWQWTARGQKIDYTLMEFNTREFRPAAVIRKSVETKMPPTITETIHVYARGVGEVERKQYETQRTGPKRLIMETKLAP